MRTARVGVGTLLQQLADSFKAAIARGSTHGRSGVGAAAAQRYTTTTLCALSTTLCGSNLALLCLARQPLCFAS